MDELEQLFEQTIRHDVRPRLPRSRVRPRACLMRRIEHNDASGYNTRD